MDNHINNLFQYYDCTIYFHTYEIDPEFDSELLALFTKNNLEVKKYLFEPFVNQRIAHSIKKGTELVDIDKHDIIISLRFDLLFLKPITSININLNAINISFKDVQWENPKFYFKCSDKLFIFPPDLQHHFVDGINFGENKHPLGYSGAHWIFEYLKNNLVPVDFMIDGLHKSDTSTCNGFLKILG